MQTELRNTSTVKQASIRARDNNSGVPRGRASTIGDGSQPAGLQEFERPPPMSRRALGRAGKCGPLDETESATVRCGARSPPSTSPILRRTLLLRGRRSVHRTAKRQPPQETNRAHERAQQQPPPRLEAPAQQGSGRARAKQPQALAHQQRPKQPPSLRALTAICMPCETREF